MTTQGDEGLLDTSTVVLLPAIADPAVLPRIPLISAVTLAELSVGPLATDDPAERARRQERLQQAEADFDPLPFDAAAARAFGRVAQAHRVAGRTTRARAYDAMIAAVALANGMAVHTANPSDFQGIPGLEVVDVRPGIGLPPA